MSGEKTRASERLTPEKSGVFLFDIVTTWFYGVMTQWVQP